jgi:amino acid adenylation domain-containing protein/non-ribosomal peptide synthase protein (TIGR01720 family)
MDTPFQKPVTDLSSDERALDSSPAHGFESIAGAAVSTTNGTGITTAVNAAAQRESAIVDAFGLSPLQQGMLFHHVKEPHSGIDIEQLVVHLSEPLDISSLEGAWRWLVARHDMLRARFVWDGADPPRHEVLSEAEISLPFTMDDAGGLSEDQQRARLRAFLDLDRIQGFDLRCAPLSRVKVFRWAGSRWSMVWTFHHILLDGRTFPTLLRELFDEYGARSAGSLTIPTAKPAPPAFRRHIEWMQAPERQHRMAAGERFFKEMLAGFTAPTPIPIDRLVTDAVQPDGLLGETWDGLDAASTRALHEIATSTDLTLNAIVMAAWAILLHRYSGEHDIVFGATRACRKSSVSEADETIGPFINTVPVRVMVRDEEPVLSTAREIRHQWIAMRPYEHTSLARIKTVSDVPAGQSLFDTLVVFENYSLGDAMGAHGGAWAGRRVELHELTSFPITLAAYDGESLRFKLEFNRQRIDDGVAQRMLGHLRMLLEGIAAAPSTSCAALDVLTTSEHAQLADWNRTEIAFSDRATLQSLFHAQAARTPEAVALVWETTTLTYAELQARVKTLGQWLRTRGVGPDVLVGICVERSPEMVIGLLGILEAGGAYVPIDPAYPAERVAYMLDDAGVGTLLTQAHLLARLPSHAAQSVCLDTEWAAIERSASASQSPSSSSTADDLAYLIYTSGSTGRPKGALNGQRGIVNRLEWMQRTFRLTHDDVVLQKTPFSFDVSVWEFFWPLIAGARLVVAKSGGHQDPAYLVDLIRRERVSVLHFVPSMLRVFLETPEVSDCQSIRALICSGEALPPELVDTCHAKLPADVHNLYGPTEAAVDVTWWPCPRSGSTRILDARLLPVPIGVAGELYLGGVQVGRGYHRQPELTAERFIPDPFDAAPGARLYKTGDLCRFLPSGDIEYLGRLDHQVKIRGFRIELGEIESALGQHAAIREAVVMAREDVPGSKRLVAYLVTAPEAPTIGDVREHLTAILPEYMVPAAFVFLDKLPLSTNGKIDRKALPAPELQRPDLAGHYVAPRTPVERTLAAIWEKVLRVPQIGVDDNFFALGGDSILSIQVLSLARAEGLTLTPTQLFANQTVAQLAAVADRVATVRTGESSEVHSEEGVIGDVPLTPIQHWFFQQQLVDPQHYNQAFLFEVTESLDRARLQRAVEVVSSHHDALCLRFTRDASGWRQRYADQDKTAPLTWIDLAERADLTDEDEVRRQIESIAESTQASLNIEHGPLWQVVYVDLGVARAPRLLIVVHHLAVDGISWRPLLGDLETAYRQLMARQPIQLPAKSASYKAWSVRLQTAARAEPLRAELPYWKTITDPRHVADATKPLTIADTSIANTEGASRTLSVSLAADETQALLRQAPAAYRTQINDLLLTALARAWHRWSSSRVLFTNLEGHGREALDPTESEELSRTVGWFTSIFPVRLELPESATSASADGWHPGETIKSIKEQLRQIPRRGVGYGMLRYAGTDADRAELADAAEPPMVFNYLGQFDQVLAGSTLLRFARESAGACHGPGQTRRHLLEVNSLVISGRLELQWTYCPSVTTDNRMRQLAEEFLASLRAIVAHCQSPDAWGRTPADFPLARVDQATLDRLIARRRDVVDLYPLSPIQTLFFSTNPDTAASPFDQWHATLHGPLDVSGFQQAWQESVQRHTILRSTIHGAELREPLQMVHREVRLPWTIEDWRGSSSDRQTMRWAAFLKQDRAQPLSLTDAPAMRFALVRVDDEEWKFLWSVPALLLDGWSWPLVFRDVSRSYDARVRRQPAPLEPVRPYRDYVDWIEARASGDAEGFWRTTLAGFREPTPLPTTTLASDATGVDERDDRFAEASTVLSAETARALQLTARRLQLTLNTLVQGAWALLLGRQSGATDVVFGAAFAGRPDDLRGADSIVGPFVNNLPVRIAITFDLALADFFKQVQRRLLEIAPFQFTPLRDIQRSSEVPWRHRLFDSLVVFQNYLVDDAARRFGGPVEIRDFVGPIHTSYPVLLLAEPGETLRLSLIYDRHRLAATTATSWAADLAKLLTDAPEALDRTVSQVQAGLSPRIVSAARPSRRLRARAQDFVPPQTDMERRIADVWRQMFALEQVGIEENVFDLGGTSLLLVEMHQRVRETLRMDFPMITLFEHPTIKALARHLGEPGVPAAQTADRWRERAARQKQALAQLRTRSKQ